MTTVVDATTRNQTLIGWGSTNLGPPVYTAAYSANADALWRPAPYGIGQSIYNCALTVIGGVVGPEYQNNTWTANIVGDWSHEQQAWARGVRIFCVRVWTYQTDPGPYTWQVNGSTSATGALNAANYSDATVAITTFLTNAVNAGVYFTYVSFMNEPDFTPSTYGQISWSTAQAITFLNDLHTALVAWAATSAGLAWQSMMGLPIPKVMWGETADWHNSASWIGSAETDPGGAVGKVDLYTTHQYFGAAAIAPPTPCSHPVICSEYSPQGPAWDVTMTTAMTMMGAIRDALRTGKSCGYMYWWSQADNQETDNEGLLGFAVEDANHWNAPDYTKRLYCFGNLCFAKPGSTLVGVTGEPAGVDVLPFQLSDGNIVVVCTNNNASPTAITVSLTGCTATQVTPWITDATRNQAAQTPITPSGGTSFSATLAATSVTTFVGQNRIVLTSIVRNVVAACGAAG